MSEVALYKKIAYNYGMDHLREYVREWMEFHKSERDCSNESEEDTFEIVMEDVGSIVQDYTFADYSKASEKEEG